MAAKKVSQAQGQMMGGPGNLKLGGKAANAAQSSAKPKQDRKYGKFC